MFNLIKVTSILLLGNKNIRCFSNSRINTKLFSKGNNKHIESQKGYDPRSENQNNYISSLNNKNLDLIFCLGPAGTGKTLFACKYAIEELQKNNFKKIIITRPMIAIEENMGFLPGDIKEKMHPWTIPIFDVFEECYTRKDINSMITNNIIEIAPLGFMQGRTFKNSIIIADEMQNSTPNQMFMLLTRIGDNSKMIITGDPAQTINTHNGLNDIITKLNTGYYSDYEMSEDKIKIVKMVHGDIQRHHIVSILSKLYSN
jgi:phosphate starvation-inducible PhoH-like protein